MKKQTKEVTLKQITREYISPSKETFRAVNQISLEIHAGEFVTLLGPSGCGKTTTLRMIAGFETPTEGEIYIGGECVNALTPDKRDTAMVFQSYALFPHYNVYNNISFGLRLKKLPEKEISERVHKIMELVGLTGMEERFQTWVHGDASQGILANYVQKTTSLSELKTRDEELARAKDLNIRIVYGKDLLRLDEMLLSWASRA